MTKEEFLKQMSRLQDEWPRGYGPSKHEMFARHFAGHELHFFSKVVDRLLEKFRFAPQVSDVWSAISEVQGEVFKQEKAFKQPEQRYDPDCGLTKVESKRRWAVLHRFMLTPELHTKDPDWLRRKLWPNETKEESEKKYAAIVREDAREIRTGR